MHKNILQTIFSDHFEYIQYVIRPDKNVLDNINRMILCRKAAERLGLQFKLMINEQQLI